MCFCKYLNQGKSKYRVFQETKQKQNMKRLSFITQFKILPPFAGCRKVPGKIPANLCYIDKRSTFEAHFLKLNLYFNVLQVYFKFSELYFKYTLQKNSCPFLRVHLS